VRPTIFCPAFLATVAPSKVPLLYPRSLWLPSFPHCFAQMGRRQTRGYFSESIFCNYFLSILFIIQFCFFYQLYHIHSCSVFLPRIDIFCLCIFFPLQFNFLIINPSSDGPLYNTESLKTGAGVGITSFAKFTTFGKDLYADLVAPGLRTSLLGMSSFPFLSLFLYLRDHWQGGVAPGYVVFALLSTFLFFALSFSTTIGKELRKSSGSWTSDFAPGYVVFSSFLFFKISLALSL